jgi:hypothetical protein
VSTTDPIIGKKADVRVPESLSTLLSLLDNRGISLLAFLNIVIEVQAQTQDVFSRDGRGKWSPRI